VECDLLEGNPNYWVSGILYAPQYIHGLKLAPDAEITAGIYIIDLNLFTNPPARRRISADSTVDLLIEIVRGRSAIASSRWFIHVSRTAKTISVRPDWGSGADEGTVTFPLGAGITWQSEP
jgi:hypothetical protein